MRKSAAIALAAFLLLAGIWICWGARAALQSAREVQEMSKMRHVGQVVSIELEAYYRNNARYPAALADLNLSADRLTGEGASLADLAHFTYRSAGDGFSMVWPHHKYGFNVSGLGTNQTFAPLHPPPAANALRPTNSWRLLQ